MTSPTTGRKRGHTNTILPDEAPTMWQPPAASAQYRELTEQPQSHLRPGADVTQEPTDSPDKLLIKFLRSNETYEVDQPSDPREARKTSQGVLREILRDERWDRRMIEDFYKVINPSVEGLGQCLTPYPFHRTLYLVLLNALEDKEKVMQKRESESSHGKDGEFVQAQFANSNDPAHRHDLP